MTKVAAERLRAQGQPIGDVYLDRQEIAVRVAELGTAIAETYAGRMPLLVGWGLVALFIWFAENIGTFARAWTYPSQDDGWHMVGLEKLGSWYLLMIISFVLVSLVQRPKAPG